MSKRKENWIRIITPEGKYMITSPQNIKKLMGLDVDPRIILNRILDLEHKVTKLELPQRHEKILKILHGEGARTKIWLFNRVPNFRWDDLDPLINDGRILESKSGTHNMYSARAVILK